MISVCIPTFNRAQTLAQAIASAQAQSVRDIEILVLDNHSSDGTEALVRAAARADSRIRYVRHAENLGLTRNFSACISEARGETIKLLCDDDLLAPGCVARLAEALSRPGVALAACARQMTDDELKPLRVVGARAQTAVIDGETMTRELFVRRNSIGEPTAVLFRRADALRGFDARYQQAFDVEMWCHLLRRGALAFLAEPLCSVRMHSAQATRANIRAGRIIDDKRRLFREILPTLGGELSSGERWLWDLRMASSVGRMRAAGERADAAAITEVFHPQLFRRAMMPLAAAAWSVARRCGAQ
jgi:glycosyltransferase involved in cell wall biosynthesis